ncbi:glycosyltransferase family 2 protein [Chryseobacterium sp. VAUSW3]|uniref:glycosyltransferase family 2 protein n=1 Tax=Chryseobacterium sp. VAUSW3 TaxID=2010998 RepID=UPI000B4D7A23|nr:glycosyltransferase family A protein [Chryseobacterium sp. VAUSW3]OWR15750.1 glycosyl transferase family 2 [Chryseobacterium sp. VAUSW3]
MKEIVSVVIPCYNQGDYIEETVESVLGQTYSAIEILIVNDGSTDHSYDVIKKILEHNPDIKYIQLENGGVSRARNRGIEKASGKYILPLDADDLIERDYISLAMDEFSADPQLMVVTAQGRFFGREERDWNLADFTMKKILHGNVIFCPSIFKKSDWRTVGGFDENMTHLEDWDFYIRLTSLRPNKVKRLNYRALLYRIKEENARNTEGFKDGTYNDTVLYLYTKNKNLFFEHYGNPSLMIKEIEKLKWEHQNVQKELNFLRRFSFNRFLLKLRKKKHGG